MYVNILKSVWIQVRGLGTGVQGVGMRVQGVGCKVKIEVVGESNDNVSAKR